MRDKRWRQGPLSYSSHYHRHHTKNNALRAGDTGGSVCGRVRKGRICSHRTLQPADISPLNASTFRQLSKHTFNLHFYSIANNIIAYEGDYKNVLGIQEFRQRLILKVIEGHDK